MSCLAIALVTIPGTDGRGAVMSTSSRQLSMNILQVGRSVLGEVECYSCSGLGGPNQCQSVPTGQKPFSKKMGKQEDAQMPGLSPTYTYAHKHIHTHACAHRVFMIPVNTHCFTKASTPKWFQQQL